MFRLRPAKQRSFFPRAYTAFILIVSITVLLAGCALSATQQEDRSLLDGAELKTVKTAPVTKAKWPGIREQAGEVLPSLQLDVILKVDGDVTRVFKKRGDVVKKGETILEIDKTDILRQKEKLMHGINSLQEQLRKGQKEVNDSRTELQNSIRKTEDALKEMEKDYNRMRNEYDMGLVSKRQVEQMETRVNSLRMDLLTLKEKLETLETTDPLAALEYELDAQKIALADLERTLSYHDVKAPIDGLLTEMPAEEGMTLSRGFKIGVIQQQDPVKIRAELTESDLDWVRGKTEISFLPPDGTEKRSGRITYLAKTADLQTKTFTLELEAANPDGKLMPGTRVRLVLAENGDQEVIAVPAASVLEENGKAYVFVLVGDHVEKRNVTLGRTKDTLQEITGGLNPGEQLVVVGHHQLKDGEKVRVAP